VPEIKK